jgi:hypothetical protein
MTQLERLSDGCDLVDEDGFHGLFAVTSDE